jgi:hypothetical protein
MEGHSVWCLKWDGSVDMIGTKRTKNDLHNRTEFQSSKRSSTENADWSRSPTGAKHPKKWLERVQLKTHGNAALEVSTK